MSRFGPGDERPDLVELALGALRAKLEGAQRAVDELLNAASAANRPDGAERALSVKNRLAEAALAAKRAA